MTQPLRVAIYARFSTDKQRDASLDDQIDDCRDYAAAKGWVVAGIYSDRAVSGASMFRAGIEHLQRDARAGKFDVVLSEAMDRLSRNLSDISKFGERMEHARVKIETIAEGEVNEMMVGLKGTMNAIALRDIGLKTRRGQKGRVKEGKIAGGNSYGYTVITGVERGGKIERGDRAIDPVQAKIVRRIFGEYAAGTSPREIAARLNQDGVPGPRGGT